LDAITASILLLNLLAVLLGIFVFHHVGIVDEFRNFLDPVRRSSLAFCGYTLLACFIAICIENLWLVPQRLVSEENGVLAFWFLVLPIQYIVLTVRGLLKGEDLKIGKHTMSHSRNARIMILGLLFAFLGFLLGGQYGIIGGVLMAAVISIVIQRLIDRKQERSQLQ